MKNETKCPECGSEFESVISKIYTFECGSVSTGYQSTPCKTIQALKKENESQKSTIRNVFNDLECGYDNGMIQTKMKNKSYSTDKWGNPTEAET